jgi:8-oxo-dGTP pyrophosphatase MutT (NUDIX family)
MACALIRMSRQGGGGRIGLPRKPKAKRKDGTGRQCAALAFADRDGEIQVLLVTSRETRRWVLPKGWAEDGLAPAVLAAKEAFEEAGALGEVAPEPIGTYRYRKRLEAGAGVACEVGVFPMRVARLLEEWPEATERERRWFSPQEAAERVEEAGLADLLRRFPDAAPGGGGGGAPSDESPA